MTKRTACLLALLPLLPLVGQASPAASAEPAAVIVSSSQPMASLSMPTHRPMPSLIDTGLYTSVIAYRTLDFFSTEQCIHSPDCYEKELPTWLVNNKPVFAIFEGTTAAGEIAASRWLHTHGHGRMARAVDLVSVSSGTWTVAHNYAIQRY